MLLQDGTPYVTEKGVGEALLLFVKLSLPSDEEIKNEMGKKTKYYDLAEMRALTIPVIMWRFCAYKTEKDYESGKHYFVKDFLDHTEMKVFSGKHSAKEKSLYPDYCSMYWKIKTVLNDGTEPSNVSYDVSGSLLPLDVHKKARELSAGEFIDWWLAQKQ